MEAREQAIELMMAMTFKSREEILERNYGHVEMLEKFIILREKESWNQAVLACEKVIERLPPSIHRNMAHKAVKELRRP